MPRPSTAVRRVKGTFSLQRAPGGRPLLPGSRSAQSAPVVAERGRRGRVPSGPAAPGGGGTSTYFPNVNVPFSHPSGVRAQKDGRKVRPCDEGTFTSSTAIDTRGGSGGNPGRVGRQPGAGRATTRAGRTGGAPVVDSGSAECPSARSRRLRQIWAYRALRGGAWAARRRGSARLARSRGSDADRRGCEAVGDRPAGLEAHRGRGRAPAQALRLTARAEASHPPEGARRRERFVTRADGLDPCGF